MHFVFITAVARVRAP